MEVDPFAGWGLRPVGLADRGTFDAYFGTLAEPLSDYTFSQIYTWRNSLRILWKEIGGNLCVFANGSGDLTMLMPPIGEGGGERALGEAYEMMDAYNAAKGVIERSRVEYVSEELLRRLGREGTEMSPLGMDYVYDTRRMIDLAGGDLASKRQGKNRFMRNYQFRVEGYERVKHLGQCLNLLGEWKEKGDGKTEEGRTCGASRTGVSDLRNAGVLGGESVAGNPHPGPPPAYRERGEEAAGSGARDLGAVKREKESLAAELTLDAAEQLGLRGMVVYVADGEGRERVRGFTFGEWLGSEMSSITVEKTDLSVKGLAQFIFSEFCAREWGGGGW